MANTDAQQQIDSALSSLRLIWDNIAPEHGDGSQQTAWALAAVAQTQAAIALALLEVADSIRESKI